MRAEYDLSKLKGRVRGKYAEPSRETINLIERTDERTLTPEHPGGFGLNVVGIDLGVSTQEIVGFVREGREDSTSEENGRPDCPAVEDGASIKPRA